jgi:hypothetical protein
VSLLPTPQLHTAALLATLRTEVTHRSGKEHTMTVCLPAIELVNIDAMAPVDNVPAVSAARRSSGAGHHIGGTRHDRRRSVRRATTR